MRISDWSSDVCSSDLLSNDLRKLTLQTAQLSSYSSAKGRMLAVLFLVRRGDDILIEMPRSILDATLSRLKMFVLRARLTIEKADDIDALAIFGNDAPAMMSRYALPVPEVPLQCIDRSEEHTSELQSLMRI